MTDAADWQADWEGTRAWHRRRAAALSPRERLDWLETTKQMVAAAWRTRHAANPGFSPAGEWWRMPTASESATAVEPIAPSAPIAPHRAR